jgi:hypothetical protein
MNTCREIVISQERTTSFQECHHWQVKDGNIYKINRGSIIPAEYTCLIPLFSFSAKTRFSQVRSNQLSLRIQKKGVSKLAN